MEKFLEHMQRRIAETCLGPSSLRNQGSGGVIQAARDYFAVLRLEEFALASDDEFRTALNTTTGLLCKALPADARNWGTARKAINLFLRDALYNRYLADHYSLHIIEPYLEVPLDNDVAKGLRKSGDRSLPRWKSIKSLTESDSLLYQAEASRQARNLGTCRVHLDLLLWRPKKEEVRLIEEL